jgi:MFS family permease
MQKAWQLLLPIIIFGMGHGINIPSIQTMIAELAPSEYRGALMSLNGMILRLGQTLGPLIMGLLYTFGGVNIVYFSGAIFAIGIFFLLLSLFNLHKT